MLKIHTLTLGAYQTNCYIVHSENSASCCIIDPGYETQVILRRVQSLGLTVDAVLLTHGHFDHVGGVEEIVRATGCSLWMSESDYTQFNTPENDFYYPIHDCDFTTVRFCEDQEKITAGGLTFTVGSASITLTSLAIAAIAGIVLNALLPGKDYEFEG